MKKNTLFVLLFFVSHFSAKATEDTTVVLNLIEKAKITETLDSTYFYLNKAIVKAEKIKYYDGLLSATKIIGDLSVQEGNIEKGIAIYQETLKKYHLNNQQ